MISRVPSQISIIACWEELATEWKRLTKNAYLMCLQVAWGYQVLQFDGPTEGASSLGKEEWKTSR